MYIDKDNKIASKAVKDYQSIPAVWEAQHMWNHLGNLNVNTFTYDIANDIYYHDVDLKSEEDLYLMTYLSYSLTPMLSDTLNTISFKVEGGKITKLIAQTEAIYYNVTEENKTGDSMSYTKLELTFADIGTAKVADPVPFEAPEYVEKLEAALASMGKADNYTYKAVDTTTYSPDIDGGDYEVDGTTYSAPATTYKVNNNTSMVGEVGSVGKIPRTPLWLRRPRNTLPASTAMTTAPSTRARDSSTATTKNMRQPATARASFTARRGLRATFQTKCPRSISRRISSSSTP